MLYCLLGDSYRLHASILHDLWRLSNDVLRAVGTLHKLGAVVDDHILVSATRLEERET